MALRANDLAGFLRARELEGKALALFSERHVVNLPEQRELSGREVIEAQRLAGLMLDAHMAEAQRSLPATVAGLGRD
jgi:hypothetical protein